MTNLLLQSILATFYRSNFKACSAVNASCLHCYRQLTTCPCLVCATLAKLIFLHYCTCTHHILLYRCMHTEIFSKSKTVWDQWMLIFRTRGESARHKAVVGPSRFRGLISFKRSSARLTFNRAKWPIWCVHCSFCAGIHENTFLKEFHAKFYFRFYELLKSFTGTSQSVRILP